MEEKALHSMSGYINFAAGPGLLGGWLFIIYLKLPAVLCGVAGLFLLKGLVVINPSEAAMTTFFGDYTGTLRQPGLRWINPFFSRKGISLRARNPNGQKLKGNDKLRQPD